MLRRCSLLLLFALLVLAGCGGMAPTVASAVVVPAPSSVPPLAAPLAGAPAAVAAESFVGRVDHSDAFVALIADGARVTAYVCDGAALVAWFGGAREGETIILADDKGRRLTATLTPGPAGRTTSLSRGSLHTADGVDRSFAADRATDLPSAGLYRSSTPARGGDAEARVGVIVMADGEFRGAYYAGETVTPVTEARLGTGSLTALVPGRGSFEAARLMAPEIWEGRSVRPGPLAYRHREALVGRDVSALKPGE